MNRRQTTVDAQKKIEHHQRHNKSDRAKVVELARKYTEKAFQKLADLMDGKGGKVWVLDKTGALVQIDVEVPAAVQAKCAELFIERGYGKAPQAILIADDTPEGRARLNVHEKIAAIKAAREGQQMTTDLEASEIVELPALETPPAGTEIVPIAAQRAEDFLNRTEPVLSPADLI